MDGVLIDSENLWQENERALFSEFGIELSDRMLAETRGLRTEEMVAYWLNRFPLNGVDPEELKQRYDERMVEKMYTEVPLMEGAREALAYFRNKGLPMALASCSTRAHIDAAMDRHGLKDAFGLILSAAHRMPGKPHPEIYLQTAAQLGVDPTFCLAIEDTFFGVISALSARMTMLKDREFVRGWTARLRVEDEQDPEVRRV